MKRKMLSVLLCAAMMGTTLAGATSVLAADDKDSDSKWEYKEATLTFLIDPDTASSGYQAVFDLCEKETGIHIETELRASGGDGDNQVKTRLASGEMTDLCGYNSGAKLNELDPESNFIDISGEEWASRLDDTFASAVSAGSDSAVYGVPLTATNLGCILYNKDLYEKYDLEVPDTWEDFLKNCDTLKDAGETELSDLLEIPGQFRFHTLEITIMYLQQSRISQRNSKLVKLNMLQQRLVLRASRNSLTFSHTLTRITQQLHTQMHAISL